MTFRPDRISSTVQSRPNFPVLTQTIESFDSGQLTGFATLAETPFLKYQRLMFFGTGEHSDTVLHGPAISPILLEVPTLADQLLEITGEFLKQVRQLDITVELHISEVETPYSGLIDTPSNEGTLSA